jgi:hypothetical protein
MPKYNLEQILTIEIREVRAEKRRLQREAKILRAFITHKGLDPDLVIATAPRKVKVNA